MEISDRTGSAQYEEISFNFLQNAAENGDFAKYKMVVHKE